MSDKKNIDRLFQEKFKDFEVAPNDAVWNRINESLPNKKKKRRVIALWWQIGGVAAVIALLLTVGVSVFNSGTNKTEDLPIVNIDKTGPESNQDNDKLKTTTNSSQDELKNDNDGEQFKFVDSNTEKEFITNKNDNNTSKKDQVSNQLLNSNESQRQLNTVANTSDKNQKSSSPQKRSDLTAAEKKDINTEVAVNSKASNLPSKNSDATQLSNERDLKSAIKKSIEEKKTAIVENPNSNKSDFENIAAETKNTEELNSENSIIEDSDKQAIEEAIAENTIDEKEEEKQNRWSIAPNVAPVYYSSLGTGSSLDKQFNENSKNSDINISYGIAGSYAISKKLKIRTGVSRVNLSQTTSGVFAFTGAETAARGIDAQFNNIKFNGDVPNISLMSSKMLNRSSAPELFNSKIAGDIDQKFGFIEVPLELEYRLLDKKFGVNVIGGFSTFFLNQNEVYADIDGASTLIGESSNLNDTSFSANFGLGMDYSLSKQWNINLEPTFKYQINTYNNTSGNYKPFFIGVYTGLSFKF